MAKRTPKKAATKARGRPTAARDLQAAAARLDAENAADEEEEVDETEEDTDAEAAIMAEFGASKDSASWNIMIYRHTGQRAGGLPYLFSCTPDDLPIIERLRDVYRSGTYQARIFKNGKLHRTLLYSIEAPPESKLPSIPGAPAGGDFGMIIAAMDRQGQQFTTALERLAPNGQAMTPTEQMTATMALMREMREAIGTPAPAAGLQPSDVISLLKEGMSLGATLSGEKEPASMFDVIRDVLASPLVQNLLQGMPAMPGGAGAAPAQIGAPAAAGQPQAEAPQQPTQEQMQMAMLAQNLRYLVGRAAANKDVDLYCDWTIDNIDRQILERIVGLDDPVAQLAQLEPTVTHHQGWFASLVEGVRETLTAPADGPNPPDDVHSTA